MDGVKKVELQTILIEHQRTLLAHLEESRAVLEHVGGFDSFRLRLKERYKNTARTRYGVRLGQRQVECAR